MGYTSKFRPIQPELLTDIIEWDVCTWSHALDFWIQKSSSDFSSAKVLELGSRNGGLSLWMALQGAEVVCSDLEGPTKTAREKHERYGVAHRIQYERIDATRIPYKNTFDIVMFKSILGDIGSGGRKELQRRAVEEMYNALKPGGELMFAENLVASPGHKFMRRNFVSWGKVWRYVTIEEVKNFMNIFSSFDYMTTGFWAAFGRSERQREILAMLDRVFVPLIPENWRYVIIGIARKE